MPGALLSSKRQLNPMGEKEIPEADDEQRLRRFTKALLADLRALERMIEEGLLETGIRRIGAEQEMFLVDEAGRPACKAEEWLARLDDAAFTTELARFNLETNLRPQVFGGDCLSRMEGELRGFLTRARDVAESDGGGIVLSGILPTLKKTDLSLDSMVPNPRYRQLNDAMTRLRGGEFHFLIKGIDELEATHDNVMLESCNTSFQIHFQVGPEEFAPLYNVAQAITAPVLASAVNSPILLGRRLWHETRIALFQQSVDVRSKTHQIRGLRPRVSFGDEWCRDSVVEIFKEDIARFRVLLAIDADEDPEAVLERGELPELNALRLHNGTIWRWVRPLVGFDGEDLPHLRIEQRVVPAGPTIVDSVANAAFYYGLAATLAEAEEAPEERLSFGEAGEDFPAAARDGRAPPDEGQLPNGAGQAGGRAGSRDDTHEKPCEEGRR